jgi:hypothetical protein
MACLVINIRRADAGMPDRKLSKGKSSFVPICCACGSDGWMESASTRWKRLFHVRLKGY